METDSSSKISEGNKQTEHGKKHTFKLDTKFVRIEYPGLVKNVDKAIDTLGGIKRIEMVIKYTQITEQIHYIFPLGCIKSQQFVFKFPPRK